MLKALLKVILILSLLTTMGCTVGIKERIRVITHDPIPLKESSKGTIRIATNKPIPLVIHGQDDLLFEKNVGGYTVVTPAWYAALIESWNKHH